MMLAPQLCIEIAKKLKYVCWQFPASGLKADIKDYEMIPGYLSATVVRQIALLVKEMERTER